VEDSGAPRVDPHSNIERRVATIMHADIAGYSRLMGEDEEHTIRRFRGHREIFESVVKMHRGRIFNTAGDALLAEFPSSVEAVRCATEIQAALHTRNEQLPPKARLQFRIGINLGDVIVQGGDLLGDGVNIAARVQTAADPGGISISGSVYDQIQNKLSLHFQPLGEKSFKNIAQPIRTFAIQLGNTAPPAPRPRWGVLAGGVAGVVALASAGYWGYQEYSAQRVQRDAEAARQAADTAKREAEVRVQRQALEEAMRKVEEAKKEAELRAQKQVADEAAKKSAEMAKREAMLLAQRLAADVAARRAADERKRLEQERQAAAAEAARAAEARAKAAVAPAPRPTAGFNLAQFDGTYEGRICNHLSAEPEKPRCWPVALQVQSGTLTGTWKSGVTGKPSSVTGKITTEGAVTAMLDGWHVKTKEPLGGTLAGRWLDGQIDLRGRWNGGNMVSARWRKSP
jgi:class 3 adenylate cyclase